MQRYAENGRLAKGLQNFQFEGKEVRVVIEENNVLLFVAVDVCNILGYKNVSDVLGRLGSDGVVSNYPIPDKVGRNQPTNLLTEQGLESLISGSRKVEASRFDEWVKEIFYQKTLKILSQNIDFQTFVFEDEFFIRTWLDENANPWFIAYDVCRFLELQNVGQALARLDEDEKNTIILNDGNRGNPNQSIINESGLYSLVFSSRKPEAKVFKKWVTNEVLPTIRKTGKYEMPEAKKDNSADLVAQMEMLQKRVLSLENTLRNNDYVTESFLRVVIDGFTELADDILDNRIYPTLDKQEARLKLLEDIIQHIAGIPTDDEVEIVNFYLIQEGDSVWHKMGISSDVPDRKTKLSTGNSSELHVVLTIPFYSRRLAKAFEDYMQDYFKANKKRGEWFALNQNDLLFIERLGMVYRAHYEGRWENLPKNA